MRRPSVCACYIEANEPEALQRSLDVMSSYDWITDFVVVHTDRNGESRHDRNIKHIYEDFGHGFTKQPEDGGFDEISARNRMLQAGRATGCHWLLILDADEFFVPNTIDEICAADRDDKDAIFFECFHFFSPTQHLVSEIDIRASTRSPVRLHDPHLRAIRSSSDIAYRPNQDEEFRECLSNRTMHCTYTHIPGFRSWFVAGVFHIHTHHMYGSKRDAYMRDKKLADLPLRTVRTNVFPQIYLDAYTPYREQPCRDRPSARATK